MTDDPYLILSILIPIFTLVAGILIWQNRKIESYRFQMKDLTESYTFQIENINKVSKELQKYRGVIAHGADISYLKNSQFMTLSNQYNDLMNILLKIENDLKSLKDEINKIKKNY